VISRKWLKNWFHRRSNLLQDGLGDDEFLKLLGVDKSDSSLALQIRDAIAIVCRVSPDRIHPTEPLINIGAISGLLRDGWDTLGFLLALEKVSGRRIPLKSFELPVFGPPHNNVRDWVLATLEIVKHRE
jgi:hypothetical protein